MQHEVKGPGACSGSNRKILACLPTLSAVGAAAVAVTLMEAIRRLKSPECLISAIVSLFLHSTTCFLTDASHRPKNHISYRRPAKVDLNLK